MLATCRSFVPFTHGNLQFGLSSLSWKLLDVTKSQFRLGIKKQYPFVLHYTAMRLNGIRGCELEDQTISGETKRELVIWHPNLREGQCPNSMNQALHHSTSNCNQVYIHAYIYNTYIYMYVYNIHIWREVI